MTILTTKIRISCLLIFMMVLAILAAGCSDSTTPDDGGDDPEYTDVPRIPEPTTPGGETGAMSDTVTVIAPLTTHYRPMVRTAMASWGLSTRCCTKFGFIGDWQCSNWAIVVGMPPAWSDSLPELSIDQCGEPIGATGNFPIARPDPWQRILLMEDGQILEQPPEGSSGDETFWSGDNGVFQVRAQCRLNWQTRPLTEQPYLRRDRFWVRQTLQNAGNFLLLVGGVEGSLATTRTHGSSVTETEEFGRSVTASAGLSFGALSLGVEVTLTQTFSTAVTVSEETSETITQTVTGEDGKTIQYQMWQLVEYYSITDAEGEPFTDPNYTVELSHFTMRASALAMVATKFDM